MLMLGCAKRFDKVRSKRKKSMFMVECAKRFDALINCPAYSAYLCMHIYRHNKIPPKVITLVSTVTITI